MFEQRNRVADTAASTARQVARTMRQNVGRQCATRVERRAEAWERVAESFEAMQAAVNRRARAEARA